MSSNNSEEIVDFIKRRFYNTNANWLNGNCYWFAKILTDRFNYLDIFYDPIVGHFVAGVDDIYYDYTGQVNPEKVYKLSYIKDNEPNWYQRILKDCIY